MIFQPSIWADSLPMSQEPLVRKLLRSRGLSSDVEIQAFLNPRIEDLKDPFLLCDMEAAVKGIREAIENNGRIWIYGDYDVDGITSITILSKYFRRIGIETHYYIPNRLDEGYGLSRVGLDYIKAQGGTLVITVDCGITALEEAQYAKTIGLELIITDHHELLETLPEAMAVINPKRGGYPFPSLAGCGVALKVTQALSGESFFDFFGEVIDIAALGTIADIVPLVDENRVITKIGLEQMMETRTPGIRALIEEAGLVNRAVDAGHIGYMIAPRINASGRIGNPALAVEMFLENDYYKALDMAKQLTALNAERQARERDIFIAADTYILEELDLLEDRVLLVVGQDWHTGIIGIVASKLVERYKRPVVILNVQDGMAKGSARSIPSISIHDVLKQFSDLYEKFGGHEQAAGLTIKASHLETFKARLRAYGLEHIPEYQLIPERRVDAVLLPDETDRELALSLEQLKPFGVGNPKPQFAIEALQVEDARIIGKQKNHLKLIVGDEGRVYNALVFNQAELAPLMHRGDAIRLLANVELNRFMGVETVQFVVKDLIKPNMPTSPLLELELQKAIQAFITEAEPLMVMDAVSKTDIWNEGTPLPQRLHVYSEKALNRLRAYVVSENITRYTIHVNRLNANECRDGYADILFMPISSAAGMDGEASIYRICDDAPTVKKYMPNREDLIHLYTLIKPLTSISATALSQKGHMRPAKIFLGLDLLSDMALLTYGLRNGSLYFHWQPRPQDKMDIQGLKRFQEWQRKWSHE